jgi:hypothetical protein
LPVSSTWHAGAVDQRDETEPRDQADLVQRCFALGVAIVRDPSLELAKDRIPGVAADANDEGKTEFLPVGGVELAEAVKLLGAEAIEAETALLGLGVVGQFGAFEPAAKFGMAADEGQLPFGVGLPDRLHHGIVQRRDGRVGSAGRRGLRHPGGEFEHFAQCRDKGGSRQAVEAGKGLGGAGHCANFTQLPGGTKLFMLADQRV